MSSFICTPYKAINLYTLRTGICYRHTNLCRGKEQKHNLQEKQMFSSLLLSLLYCGCSCVNWDYVTTRIPYT